MPSTRASRFAALIVAGLMTIGSADATAPAKSMPLPSGAPTRVGGSDLPEDPSVGRRWVHQLSFAELRARAEAGDPVSQLWLARRYRLESGPPQDAAAAYAWYTRALSHLTANTALPLLAERNALARDLAFAEIREAERQAAALLLTDGLKPSAVIALGRRLGDRDPAVRLEAAALLARLGPAAAPAVPALAWAIEADPAAESRDLHLAALGRIGSAAAPALVTLIEDRGALRRDGPARLLGAVAALTVMGPAAQAAVPALVQALEDDFPDVFVKLAERFGTEPAVAAHAVILAELRLEIVVALAEIGPAARAAVPSLRAMLRTAGPYLRLVVASALSQIEPRMPLALRTLVQGLDAEDAGLRGLAIEMLRLLGPDAQPALAGLVGALGAAEASLRAAAAGALGDIGPAAGAAIPALLARLGDPEPEARLMAAGALLRIGLPADRLLGVLIAALASDQPEERRFAAEVLGTVGPRAGDAVPALETALQDGDWDVRLAAAEALGWITLGEPMS